MAQAVAEPSGVAKTSWPDLDGVTGVIAKCIVDLSKTAICDAPRAQHYFGNSARGGLTLAGRGDRAVFMTMER
jgi:hypothetical protein